MRPAPHAGAMFWKLPKLSAKYTFVIATKHELRKEALLPLSKNALQHTMIGPVWKLLGIGARISRVVSLKNKTLWPLFVV